MKPQHPSFPDSIGQTHTENHNTNPTNSTKINSTWPLLLFVEDNTIALKMLESVAQQAHCHCISATSGEMAFELVKTHQFDLIVTDIGLPGISGNELTLAIREFERISGNDPLPIIGLTAHNMDVAEQESLRAGMNKIITKPIRMDILQNLINEYILLPKKLKASHPIYPEPVDSEAMLFELNRYPLLDIEEGQRSLGNFELLKELLDLMANTAIPEDMLTIQRSHEQQDWEKIEALAHKIKSGALYCGTIRLKHACQYLERYQKTGQKLFLERLYQQFCATVMQTQLAINEWLTNNE